MHPIAAEILSSTRGQETPWIFPVVQLEDGRVIARALTAVETWNIPGGAHFWGQIMNLRNWDPNSDQQVWLVLEQHFPGGKGVSGEDLPQGHPTQGWEIVSGWNMRVFPVAPTAFVDSLTTSFRYRPVPGDESAAQLRGAMLWVIIDLLDINPFNPRELSVTPQFGLTIPVRFVLEGEADLTRSLQDYTQLVTEAQQRFEGSVSRLKGDLESDEILDFWYGFVRKIHTWLHWMTTSGLLSAFESPDDASDYEWREWTLYLGGPAIYDLVATLKDGKVEWDLNTHGSGDTLCTASSPWEAMLGVPLYLQARTDDDLHKVETEWLHKVIPQATYLFDPSLLSVYEALGVSSPFARPVEQLVAWGRQAGLLP